MGTGPKLPRVLLVDDHRDTVEVTAFLLAKNGYCVVPAYSVAGARAAAATHPCDLMISDIGLPDGNGVELMRELQKQYGMKGVLVSGAVKDTDAIEASGYKFLAKPIDLQRLLEALKTLRC